MTLEEIKDKRENLKKSIGNLISAFEKETHCKISKIHLDIDSLSKDSKENSGKNILIDIDF